MAVYVDSASIPYRNMKMNHLVADTQQELNVMAMKLELNPLWIQNANTYKEHYDVSLSKRHQAVKLGAIPVSPKELVKVMTRKRNALKY